MYFNIERSKVGLNKKIMLISDIHYYHIYNTKIFDGIIKRTQIEHPDYICIAGDLLDNAEEGKHPHVQALYAFISKLSTYAPVFIVLGNHDIKAKREGGRVMPTKCLVKINKIKNVYLLNEKGLTFDNITFYGFNAPYNYYYDGKESNRDLLEESFKIKAKDTYNILLTHSPINLTDADTYEEMDLKRFNLILCGHMHNGLMPHFMPGHMGLVAPFRKFFPYDARGTIKHGKTTFVISGGVEKLSHSAGILHYLNGIYPVSITIIQ